MGFLSGENGMEQSDILKRIDELLAINVQPAEEVYINSPEVVQGATSLLSLVYGAQCAQLQQLNATLSEIAKQKSGPDWKHCQSGQAAQGALRNLKREMQSGLTGSLRHQITGEVLTDLIQLARTILNEPGDDAKNVAAVLAAAAFEDTIRRMGASLAGVVGKDDLAEVLKKLKDAAVIQSPQVGIAQSYLSFRNHALHANWSDIGRESVHSALGFVEQLLVKHFT